MNIADLPGLEPDINALLKELSDFCEKNSISRFEPDDIKELLEDGEEVEWIVDQLKQDNQELDEEKLTSILTAIHSIVAPPKEEEEQVAEEEIGEEGEADFLEEDLLTESGEPLDLSQIDLAEMAPQLEAMTGMKIPKGVDLNQLKKLMDSPQGKMLNDFGLFCQELGVDMNNISDPKKLEELNEQWMATPREAFNGQTPAEASGGDTSLLSMKKVETYRRSEPRIGRNDPCPCGSGKKYKKCCGRNK